MAAKAKKKRRFGTDFRKKWDPPARPAGITPAKVYKAMETTRTGMRRAYFLKAYRRTGSSRGCAGIMGCTTAAANQVLRFAIRAEAQAFLSLCRTRN